MSVQKLFVLGLGLLSGCVQWHIGESNGCASILGGCYPTVTSAPVHFTTVMQPAFIPPPQMVQTWGTPFYGPVVYGYPPPGLTAVGPVFTIQFGGRPVHYGNYWDGHHQVRRYWR